MTEILTRTDLVRLVAETHAAADAATRFAMAQSMDIDPARLHALFEANEREWDTIKAADGLIRAARDSFMRMPADLCPAGFLAWRTICSALVRISGKPLDTISTGGATTFYSPAEWVKRGERYGDDSALIVVYDGSQVRRFFDCDDDDPLFRHEGEMRKELADVGLFAEPGTHWYSSIYVANQAVVDSLSIPVPKAP